MAGFLSNLQNVLGGAKATTSSIASDAGDFADFATAASPAAPSHTASSAFPADSATPAANTKNSFGAFQSPAMVGRPYTAWYRVWERVTIADFYQELVILPIILLFILLNLWGASANRKRAKQWADKHLSQLESEFAKVGFGGDLWMEKSRNEYTTYCTGRQNVAFLDIKLTLFKRYNPIMWFGESIGSFLFESIPAPSERVEATAYVFDGKEKQLVPACTQGQTPTPNKDSTYDGFVWAVVHKDKMRQLREDRYDLSLATTKDHPRLPQWATVMSESAEVTEAMLTPELVKLVEDAGELLEALIVSDQPIDAPKKINDVVPRKRVQLSVALSTSAASQALFGYFLRLPDFLVTHAHFRPEAMRKVLATREEEIRKLRKVDGDEKAEERRNASDKLKKQERDRKLSRMSAEDQKKFLEKEKEKNQRKSMKKQTMRG